MEKMNWLETMVSRVMGDIHDVMIVRDCSFVEARAVVSQQSVAGPAVWEAVDKLQRRIEA